MVSKNYNKVKKYYDKKLWDKERVKEAVRKKWITSDEYEKIIGEKYENE